MPNSERSIDPIIERDLARLAAATASSGADFEPVRARLLGGESPYRDPRPGMEARRAQALEDRRLELALLPFRLGRVFVHRVARATAGGVAVLCALALWLAAVDPTLLMLGSLLVPTVESAVLLLAVAVLVAYLGGLFAAEWAFERATRKSASAGADALDDIERHGPMVEARRLCAAADGRALSLPLLGAVLLLPLLALVVLLYSPVFFLSYEYLDLGLVARNHRLLDESIPYLAVAVAAAASVALAAWSGCARERRGGRSRLIAALGHWASLAGAVALGLFVLAAGARTLILFHGYGLVPSPAWRLVLAVLGTAAVLLSAAWAALFLRRREQRDLAL
jgi:hypothetical protein